ncbi:MAG: acyl carrier protein [Clostridiales bacterium]|jgi:acyl carrier protein|nr:acyl carrier protein [Clostridiales bacterium]
MEFERIRRLVAAQLNVDEESITMETDLIKDLKADSLDIVELIMDVESEFGIEISDEDLPGVNTVGEIVQYLKAHK